MGICCSMEEKVLVDKTKLEKSYATARLANNLVTQSVDVDPWSRYELVKQLGVGSMGSVATVKAKKYGATRDSEELFALKTIRPGRLTREFIAELKNEIKTVRNLDHPHIIKFFEIYFSDNIHILMELCSGGDLYAREPYSEIQSASIIRQVLSALAYMHSHSYIHRDIKFENIMFASKEPDAPVKIIDFGLSGRYDPERGPLRKQIGTFDTMAPEVFGGNYTTQADVWSAGVVAFELLSGQKPFAAFTQLAVISKISRHDVNYNTTVWHRLSNKSKGFCQSLVQHKAEDRPTAVGAMKHEWLQSIPSRPVETSSHEMTHQVTAYGKSPTLKKLGLLMIAHKAFPDKLKSLREKFERYDTQQTGIITMQEFRSALLESNASYSDEMVRELFDSMDIYRDGEIAYTEFVAALLESYINVTEDKVLDAFDRLDSDNTGYISNENLKHVLGRDFTDQAAREIMDAVNPAEEGKITYEEFLSAFREKGVDLGLEAKIVEVPET